LGQADTVTLLIYLENGTARKPSITARAVDNLGAGDGEFPAFLTVSGTSPGNDKPQLAIKSAAQGIVRITVSVNRYYIISMSEDLGTWVTSIR
jgi:hypothetical protein